MPAGCEFICKNVECSQNGNGFTFDANWPMGKIELLIGALASKNKRKADIDQLIAMKNDGHKYACINFPNTDAIETVAYRVNRWSPEAKCIWKFVVETEGKDISEAFIESKIPKTCPKTNCQLMSFNDVVKNGIRCPFCGEKLMQSRWFTNED